MRHLIWILMTIACAGDEPAKDVTPAEEDTAWSFPRSSVDGGSTSDDLDDGDDSDGSAGTDGSHETGTDDTAGPPYGDLEIVAANLDVTEMVLTTTSLETQSHHFRFVVTLSDGTTKRITEGVEWILNNAHIGTLEGNGRFTTSTSQGGQADVVGRFEDFAAMSELLVKYEGTLVPEGVDTSICGGPEVFESGTGMTYPADGIMIPKNEPSIHFQWEDLAATVYRLEFQSEVTELTVYSTGLSWLSDAEMWPIIGRSNAGLDVTSTLSACRTDQVVVKDSQSMSIQDLESTGSIIYWTPTAQGLMEIPYGEEAESFLTVTETGHCVGCHAVSSAGMVAFVYDSSASPLGMKTIDGLTDVIPYATAGNANYKTFSPDGSLLLTNLNGVLSLFDGITGAFISNPTIDGATWVNNMDWAPDDSYLVFVNSPGASGDLNFSGGTIMRAPHLGDGAFGPAETIVSVADLDPSYGFTTIYYPAVAPNSRWIMFNASTGDTYDDPDATLFAVSIDGGTPIELAQANISASMGNSLPKWAPATAGDEYWWFAFASRRPYGSTSAGHHQIWLSSFEPAKALAGEDPSSVAIWLANQNPDQSNHIPLWVR
jgi:hypothetical protein